MNNHTDSCIVPSPTLGNHATLEATDATFNNVPTNKPNLIDLALRVLGRDLNDNSNSGFTVSLPTTGNQETPIIANQCNSCGHYKKD
jgi:hypothetical protein